WPSAPAGPRSTPLATRSCCKRFTSGPTFAPPSPTRPLINPIVADIIAPLVSRRGATANTESVARRRDPHHATVEAHDLIAVFGLDRLSFGAESVTGPFLGDRETASNALERRRSEMNVYRAIVRVVTSPSLYDAISGSCQGLADGVVAYVSGCAR